MKNGLCGALEERLTLSTTRTGQEVSYGVNEQHLNFREQPRNTTGTLLSPAACVDRCKGAPSCMYVYLGRSLPTYGRACENVQSTYRHTDGANTDGRTRLTPETYGWSTGKPTGVGTAVKRKPFHGMYHSCLFPRVKAGTLSSAQYIPTLSCTVKPLSARTRSPGKSFCRKPQLSVKCTSDTRPPHPLDTKVTTPWGLMPIKNFTVLWCL